MPHVSKIKLNNKNQKALINNFELILTKISKSDDMRYFLASLLTPTEKLMFAKRIAIVILLKEGVSESNISNALHVTRVTVSRMQYFVESRGQGYEVALKVLEKEKLMKEFKKVLLALANYSARAAGGYVKSPIGS